MILAAARVGERKASAPPPEALRTALRCRQWGVPAVLEVPVPGWLLEQMTTCVNVYDAWRTYADRGWEMSDVAFEARYPTAWRVLMSTERLRRELRNGLRSNDA